MAYELSTIEKVREIIYSGEEIPTYKFDSPGCNYYHSI